MPFQLGPATTGIKRVLHRSVVLNQVDAVLLQIPTRNPDKTIIANEFISNKAANEVITTLISPTEVLVRQRITNAVTTVSLQIVENF